MKINMQTLVEEVKKNAFDAKPQGGLSRGTLLKLGYEYFENTTGKSPTKEEKDQIRGVIQDDLNKLGFRQDYEVVVADKPFTRLTNGGELIVGRNIKMVDTRRMALERQVKEIWHLLSQHQDKRAKQPLYDGSEAEEIKTTRLQNAIYSRLYQLEKGNELRTRVEKQLSVWFPAKVTPAAQAISNMVSVVEVAKELVEA